MATDAANAAAQQQFLADMASAQETMNNANNNQPTSTGNGARADEQLREFARAEGVSSS